MLYSTRGIVIHTNRFSETSIIAKIFTEQFGLQSYLIKGVRQARPRFKPGLFQPLSLLDLVVYHKPKNSLQNLKEAAFHHPFLSIPFDIRKSSVAVFINELIYKTVREEEANQPLFDFLAETCFELDAIPSPGNTFHLIFALRLTRYLGIIPQLNHSGRETVFDLQEGVFRQGLPGHADYLEEPESSALFHLLRTASGQESEFSVSPEMRDRLLEKILLYYQLHVPGFTEMKSHRVLHSVLS